MENLLASRVKLMENKALSDLMSLISRDDIISFAGGIPAAEIFPGQELKSIINDLIDKEGNKIFQYSNTEGYLPLKEQITTYLNKKDLNEQSSNIIITSGSQQALDLLAKIFIDPGDKVVVEKPGYVGGIGAIKSYEADIKSIPMEKDGLNVKKLETYLQKLYKNDDYIKFIYLVPDYSNPSGARMSRHKRTKILELASEYNFYIIEDTPYSELNYYDKGMECIKKYDTEGRVIQLGSFSKFFVPGLRIGWVCADEKIINLLSNAKQNTDLTSNNTGQYILAKAMKQDMVEKQIAKILPFYTERLQTMKEALEKYFPTSTEWHEPRGGFFFWVRLPEEMDSCNLLDKAVENKVAFVTGNAFYADPKDGHNYMRLSFSNTKPEEIREGIKNLGQLIKEYELSGTPSMANI